MIRSTVNECAQIHTCPLSGERPVAQKRGTEISWKVVEQKEKTNQDIWKFMLRGGGEGSIAIGGATKCRN